VPGLPLWGEPQLRIVQGLAVTPGAGGGVGGSGVEADDDQGDGSQPLTLKMKVPTFWPLTNQVTRCLPGIVEVILFT